MVENKIRLFGVFIVLSLLFFVLILVSGTVSASCCIIPDQRCDSLIGQQQCIDSGGQFNSADCTALDSCDSGCCCDPPESYSSNDNIPRFVCPANGVYDFYNTDQYPEATDNCLDFCQSRAQTQYTVQGHVYNSTTGHPLAGANIGRAGGPNVVTDASGAYTLTGFVNSTTPYTIITTRDSCVQNTSYVRINNANVVLDVILNCSRPCNPVYGNCTTTQCTDYGDGSGYQIRTCPEIACNGAPSIDIINCQISEDPFCRSINDHDQGEECFLDGNSFWPGPTGDTCPRELCIPKGELGQCHCRSNPYCGDSICQTFLEYNECEDYCELDCDNTNICANTCEQAVPVLNNVSHIYRTRALRLNWQFFGGECLDHFIVKKYSNGVTAELSAYSNTYLDTNNILSNTQYCYNITAVFNNGRFSNESNTICISTGDDYCYDSNQSSFCINEETIGRCDQSNRLVNIPCGQDQVCLMNTNDPPEAECTYQGPCDKCNGVYGMFGYLNFLVDYTLEPGNTLYDKQCKEDLQDSFHLCYYDKSDTNVDKYDFCQNILSCYDYKSRSACEAEPYDLCSKFIDPTTRCEWVDIGEQDSENSEIGIGVCRPITEELQNCSRCNDLFGTCNQKLCALYGSCYFNQEPNFVNLGIGCVGKKDMGCAEYDDEISCLNSSGPTSASLINVIWVNGTKVAGTNEFITSSNDYFRFGTCKWNPNIGDGVCFKDADERAVNNADDCNNIFNSAERKKCYHDNLPPSTTIILHNTTQDYIFPIYGAGENFDVEHYVTDDYYSGNTTTYFCLNFVMENNLVNDPEVPFNQMIPGPNPHDQYTCTYPTIQGIANLQARTTGMPSGVYDLLYFSEDPSKNIEPVESVRLYLDSVPADISCSYEIIPFETQNGNDIWVNNLSITCETDVNAICEGRLSKIIPIPGSPPIDIEGGFQGAGQLFSTEYNYMSDAHYAWSVDCTDDFGNPSSLDEEIVLEGDKSISDPRPRGIIKADSVIISINTSTNAQCKYNEITQGASPAYSAGTFFPNTGAKYHWTSISTPNSKIYGYFTSCNFTSTGRIKEGDMGDSIIFGVDKHAPVTTLMNLVTQQPFDPNYVYNNTQLQLGFVCNDTLTDLVYYGLIDFNFGCNKTSYCILGDDPDSNPNCAIDDNYHTYDSLNPIRLQFPENNYEKIIYYFSQDNGGNKEERRQARIRLSNTYGPHIIIDVT